MRPDIAQLVTKIHDAELAPEAWPKALEALTDALGAAGAAMIVSSKAISRVDWVCFSGLSAAFESKYIDHYASLDPFSPLLRVAPGWKRLSECLPKPALARSEWYNDFVLAAGVSDILGARYIDTPSHSVIFGLHQQIGRCFGDETALILDHVRDAMDLAALRHVKNIFGAFQKNKGKESTTPGARYYLHVINGRQYTDEVGRIFQTCEEATAHAAVLAAELAEDKGWAGFKVSLTDEDGRVIAQLSVPS